MKTKVVNIDGQKILLYQNEIKGSWHNDKNQAMDYFHSFVIQAEGKQAKVVKQYYSESTIEYTRAKIREIVNREKGDLTQIYDTIVRIKLGIAE